MVRQRGTRNAVRGAQAIPSTCTAPRFAQVVLLDDCFTTFQEPQIGRAAVTLLERAGFTVELAGVCCGRAMISKGFLTDARELATRGHRRSWSASPRPGVPILGLEPSCILTLADEWPELVPGAAAKRVAAAAEMADAWLARQVRDKGCHCELPPRPREGAVPRPLPPEGAGRRRRARPRRCELVPGLGRDGARRRLLRHGRGVRLREGALRRERRDREPRR